jgi:hypothetical protein
MMQTARENRNLQERMPALLFFAHSIDPSHISCNTSTDVAPFLLTLFTTEHMTLKHSRAVQAGSPRVKRGETFLLVLTVSVPTKSFCPLATDLSAFL